MNVSFHQEVTYARICSVLIYRDCNVLWRRIADVFFDSIAPLITQITLYGYFFPLLGMANSLVAPMYIGSTIFFIMFLGYSYGLRLIFDVKYTKFFEYFLLLPLPKRWLMIRYTISFVIESFMITTPLLMIGLYLLRDKFDYAQPNLFLFTLCYLLLLLFFGMLFIGLGLYYEYQWFSHNIFPRRITPLFCLSPVFLIWKRLYADFPVFAQVMFINPCTYFVEGLRSAFIGGNDFLPLSLCIPGMIFFIVLSGILINVGLKKRVNPV